MSQTCPTGKNRATPVAASAPMKSCPSPPTLTRPTRVGMAVASAARSRGIMVTPTSLRPSELPMTPSQPLTSASTGSRPEASRKRANAARDSTMPSAGRGADIHACARAGSTKGRALGRMRWPRFIPSPEQPSGLSSAGRSPEATPLTERTLQPRARGTSRGGDR